MSPLSCPYILCPPTRATGSGGGTLPDAPFCPSGSARDATARCTGTAPTRTSRRRPRCRYGDAGDRPDVDDRASPGVLDQRGAPLDAAQRGGDVDLEDLVPLVDEPLDQRAAPP